MRQCYSCNKEVALNYLTREMVNGQDVLLCRTCSTHFLRNGYTPRPINSNIKPLCCEKCNRSEIYVNIHEVQIAKRKRYLCLICESIVLNKIKKNERVEFGSRNAVNRKISNLGKLTSFIIIFLLCLIGFIGSPLLNAFFTTQKEVHEYIQMNIKPATTLFNNLQQDILNDKQQIVLLSNEKANSYFVELNKLWNASLTDERQLSNLQYNLQERINCAKRILTIAQIVNEQQRYKEMTSELSQFNILNEQYKSILISLFEEKSITYSFKENQIIYQFADFIETDY